MLIGPGTAFGSLLLITFVRGPLALVIFIAIPSLSPTTRLMLATLPPVLLAAPSLLLPI